MSAALLRGTRLPVSRHVSRRYRPACQDEQMSDSSDQDRPSDGEPPTDALSSGSTGRRTGSGLVSRVKDPAAVALGRKGGLKGGKARAKRLSAERRSEIARKAAAARWQRPNT